METPIDTQRITITPARVRSGEHGHRVVCHACNRDFGVWRMRPDLIANVHNAERHGRQLEIVREEPQP